MKRSELEHLIRAAAAITDQYELVVIGSQAILATTDSAPPVVLQSMEADLYPKNRPDLADLIDGAIGEGSPFHERFGYYAQGVGEDTAILPTGWRDRLVKIQGPGTDLKIGWCLEPHDLVASKLAAGRDKDWPYVLALLSVGVVQREILKSRIENLPIDPSRRDALARWVDGHGPSGDAPLDDLNRMRP